MIEMRWVVTRDQFPGAFSEPIPWVDGSTVYARLQYREKGLAGGEAWGEIPVISEVTETPRLELVTGRGH
jgi:hypothetical protein